MTGVAEGADQGFDFFTLRQLVPSDIPGVGPVVRSNSRSTITCSTRWRMPGIRKNASPWSASELELISRRSTFRNQRSPTPPSELAELK